LVCLVAKNPFQNGKLNTEKFTNEQWLSNFERLTFDFVVNDPENFENTYNEVLGKSSIIIPSVGILVIYNFNDL
jgi:hypothetical protein